MKKQHQPQHYICPYCRNTWTVVFAGVPILPFTQCDKCGKYGVRIPQTATGNLILRRNKYGN